MFHNAEVQNIYAEINVKNEANVNVYFCHFYLLLAVKTSQSCFKAFVGKLSLSKDYMEYITNLTY